MSRFLFDGEFIVDNLSRSGLPLHASIHLFLCLRLRGFGVFEGFEIWSVIRIASRLKSFCVETINATIAHRTVTSSFFMNEGRNQRSSSR